MSHRSFLAAALLSFICAQACQPASASWQVLVMDQVAPGAKGTAPRWATTVTDGTAVKRIESPVVSLGGRLYTLKSTTEKKRETCSQGKFPFSYSVDQISAEPLGGGQAKVVMGGSALSSAKDLMRDFMSSCDGIKPLPGAPESTESYERTRLNLLAVYGDYLGFEQVTESFSYGRPKPMVLNDWAAYKYRDDDMWKAGKKVLPEGAATEASSKFAKLPAAEKDRYTPADLSHFILAPSGGGVAAEFGVPATADSAAGTVKVIKVDRPQGIKDDYNTKRLSFVAAHPKLVNWAKASFYAVAPDQSAVVYAQDGKLFWQPASGKAKPIGQVKDVRGFQWQDGGALNPAERKALGLK